MVQYRRYLIPGRREFVRKNFEHHLNAEGGLFTPDKRRKVLGIRAKSKIAPQNMANFWSDVRRYVRNGLSDLRLVADVANSEQMKEMFSLYSFDEGQKDRAKTSIAKLVKTILESPDGSDRFIVGRQRKPSGKKEEPDAWKAFLAVKIVEECLEFFNTHGFVTSKAHQRLVDELIDMLRTEMSHAMFVERGYRNIMF